jgi:hypothetical protein
MFQPKEKPTPYTTPTLNTLQVDLRLFITIFSHNTSQSLSSHLKLVISSVKTKTYTNSIANHTKGRIKNN